MIKSLHVLNSNRILPSSNNIISDYTSIIWNTEYFGTGDFKMTIPATEKNINIVKSPDNEYISRPDDENIGVIERVLLKRGRDNPEIEVSGRFIKSLLERRIVGRANVLVDDISSGKETYFCERIRSGSRVDSEILRIVNSDIGETAGTHRSVSFIKLAPAPNIQIFFPSDRQSTGSSLLDFTDSILEEFGLGAKMILDFETKNFLYKIYKGENRYKDNLDGNRPIIFSPKLSNFINTERLKDSSGYKNAALIGGQGEGVDRFYAGRGWDGVQDMTYVYSGIKRREMFIDARDVSQTYIDDYGNEHSYSDLQYRDVLAERGKNYLSEAIVEESYSGEANPAASDYEYKKDYNVGDLITVVDEEGSEFISRILSVTESQDSDNGYTVFPKFG